MTAQRPCPWCLAALAAGLLALIGDPVWAAPPAVSAAADERVRERVEELLFEDLRGTSRRQRAERARQAVALLGPLRAQLPDDAELCRLEGEAWSQIADEPGAGEADPALTERAIALLERGRRLAPADGHGEATAAHLGILYSKLGRFAEALREYDRGIALHLESDPRDDDSAASARYSNSAETLMALGRLEEAVGRYRRGVELADSSNNSKVLALAGLAVALDRSGRLEEGRDAMQRALALDPQLKALDDDDVFFMPKGDVHYYRALAHLTEERDEPAAAALGQFLAALPDSPYAPRARAHQALLAQRAAAALGPEFRITVGNLAAEGRNGTGLRRLLQRSEARLRPCFPRRAYLGGGSDLDLLVELDRGGAIRRWVLVGVDEEPGSAQRACLDRATRALRFGAGPPGPLAIPLHLEGPSRSR